MSWLVLNLLAQDKAVTMTDQLDVWQGIFGRDYTNRNVVDWRSRLLAFREILEGLAVDRVLEVGCNRGHNLLALSEMLGPPAKIVGLEPNDYAAIIARSTTAGTPIIRGQILKLPFKDESFDLVFTAGVLIHIPLLSLASALAEMHRVTRRYLLAIEYFAEQETAIPYRGHGDLLWKRNFRSHFESQFPSITIVRSGYWEHEKGFDRTTWWLLEKKAEVRS